MDFATLADLLYASGVAAGGIGLCVFAFTGGGIPAALLELADAIRNRTRDHEEW